MAIEQIPGTDAFRGVGSAGRVVEFEPTAGFTKSANYTPRGYQQILSAGLAVAATLTVPLGATFARIQNNGTQAVRWRDDGVDPTSSLGQRISAGDDYVYDKSLSAIRLIREADGAILDIAYYS